MLGTSSRGSRRQRRKKSGLLGCSTYTDLTNVFLRVDMPEVPCARPMILEADRKELFVQVGTDHVKPGKLTNRSDPFHRRTGKSD